MKSETVFALENANWPALLVDASGGIRAASQGAKSVFGEDLAGQTLSESIWTKENPQSAEELLSAFEESSGGSYQLKLKAVDGSITNYQTQICTMPSDNGETYLLQMFKLPAGAAPILTAPVKALDGHNTSITVVEAGVAQKQKLDCAMQLIRTVALDFNNALTSILGHASLLLAKSEQKSPIRSSLVEIEKSAQRAAEIAGDLAGFSRQERTPKRKRAAI